MATARYFTLYLQETGRLKAVFDAYRTRKPGGAFVPAAVQAVQLVEQAVGAPLPTIEAQYRAWYPRVGNPQARIHTGRPVEKEIPKELFEQVDRGASK